MSGDLTYTRDLPTKPGWYWCTCANDPSDTLIPPGIVNVRLCVYQSAFDGGPPQWIADGSVTHPEIFKDHAAIPSEFKKLCGDFSGYRTLKPVSEVEGQFWFAGPIEEPKT